MVQTHFLHPFFDSLSVSSHGSVDRAPAPYVWEVMGSIPVKDSEFFFVPRSCHVDYFHLYHFINIFICAFTDGIVQNHKLIVGH